MLKSAVFTIIDSVNRYAQTTYCNGHIPKAEMRRLVRKLAMFRLGKSGNSKAGGKVKIGPLTVNYLDPIAFAYNFEEVFFEEEYFFQTDNPEPVIVDCGSNIGLATLYFKTVYPKAKIIAIEAHPTTFRALQRNVADNNLSDIEMLNVAVIGGDEKEISLMFSRPGDLRSTKIREMHGDEELQEIKVPAIRLSTILPVSVDLLKMDIEGSEDEVIDEIRYNLPQIKNVILEYHFSPGTKRKTLGQFVGLLEAAGFSCRMKSANPADKNADPNGSFVATVYGSRPRVL
jgi:FkbM family methyltransferase